MNLNEAKQYLQNKGFTLIERDLGENQDQDIYDIQDYVLHHAKYQGLAQMQTLMDWLSFDNPDANSFMGWIKTNYQPGVDFVELCNNAVLIANEQIDQNQNIPSQETFYDEDAVYDDIQNESWIDDREEAALNGYINPKDMERIKKGFTPYWAKKVTEIGPRSRKPKQSSSATELAMQSVKTPNGKPKRTYSETDWKSDKEYYQHINYKLAERIASKIDCETKINSSDKEAIIRTNKFLFKIKNSGTKYFVVRFNPDSVMDRISTSGNIVEIISFINGNLD